MEFTGELKPYSKFAENGNVTLRHFCVTCGSQIFGSGPLEDDRWTVYAGTLDDPSLFTPTDAVFTRSRQAWDRLAIVLDECETLPG
ncbi:GFA family protein [Sinorhizobium fredii]|uniref:GFA family glutathione-dependent formaldehyde-activating domain-containing protein n=1 Tax=Rhizobium fredii TaxID=380 RepID=A0A2L0H7F5_RHIFR|nr:GFA family protein [Sinorhizobium fredii]AUX77426.1 GFA family glutathione-dependent formaldehyde-activating domain-containing protein [Sinorhizobium fredii]